jgi:hypothetical protein
MKEMGAFLVFAVSLQCAAAAAFPLSHPSRRFSSPPVQMVLTSINRGSPGSSKKREEEKRSTAYICTTC